MLCQIANDSSEWKNVYGWQKICKPLFKRNKKSFDKSCSAIKFKLDEGKRFIDFMFAFNS